MRGTARSATRIAKWVSALVSVLALAAAPVLALPARPALAAPAVFPGDLPSAMVDSRMLGHLPYAEVAHTDLVAAPRGFAVGPPCMVNRDAAPDLVRLLAAAGLTPQVGKTLHAVSCFRSIAHQRAVFCRNGRPGSCVDPASRARSVGPPGYSEHATGYAIDFGIRPSPGCADVQVCMATTPAGRWLLAHAPEFGFELSFPAGNAQGVTWEPWHWRWVGANINVAGAARARLVFARARTTYPASPGVVDISNAWLSTTAQQAPISAPALLSPITEAPAPLPAALRQSMLDPIAQPGRRIRR